MIDPSILANSPAMMPPAGESPNFVDPFSLAPYARAVIYVTLPLMLIALALRLYSRIWVTRAIGADDYLCIAAAATVISYCGVTLNVFQKGYMGPHQWNVRLSLITPSYVQEGVTITCLYSTCAIFIKTSLLVFYLRIFKLAKGAHVLIWTGIITIVLFYVSCIIISAIYCNPNQFPNSLELVEFLQLEASSNCSHPQLNLSAIQGVFSTVSDVYMLTLPIVFVSRLHLSLTRKISVCAIFLVGFLATGCSVATLVFRFQERHSEDLSWFSAWTVLLGVVELNVGVICASIPVAFVLFKNAFGSFTAFVKTYLQSRHSRQNKLATQIVGSDFCSLNMKRQQYNLPKIPGAVMTGLGTFIRGGGKSVDAQTEFSMSSTYTEIKSTSEEYHRQLRSGEAV